MTIELTKSIYFWLIHIGKKLLIMNFTYFKNVHPNQYEMCLEKIYMYFIAEIHLLFFNPLICAHIIGLQVISDVLCSDGDH